MLAIPKLWRPSDLKEVWEIQNQLDREEYCLVAGGTWLRTQWEAKIRPVETNLISLENIREMCEIKEQLREGKHEITIGSAVTLTRCIKNKLLNRCFPSFVTACKKIAAPSIRNQATLGGNIFTTVGDTIPSLLINHAELIWFDGGIIAAEPLEKWLITLQANQFKRDNRILVGVRLALDEEEGRFSFFSKVGRRETFTASLVSVAGKGKISKDGYFQEVSLAAGGGGYPVRLQGAESGLENQRVSWPLLQKIYSRVVAEFQTTSDSYVSDHYKKVVTANLIISELYKWSNESVDGGVQHVVESRFQQR